MRAWCQPVPVPQRYCQDVYRGQLVSVHSAARNQELQKLAQTHHTIVSPWIGAVTSRRVRALRGQGAAKGVLGAGEEIGWGLLWGIKGWGCFTGDEPGAGGWVLRHEGLAVDCWGWFLGVNGLGRGGGGSPWGLRCWHSRQESRSPTGRTPAPGTMRTGHPPTPSVLSPPAPPSASEVRSPTHRVPAWGVLERGAQAAGALEEHWEGTMGRGLQGTG